MQKLVISIPLGLCAGLMVGFLIAGIYLNRQFGLDVNIADIFVMRSYLPFGQNISIEPLKTTYLIWAGTILFFGLAAILLTFSQRLTEYGQAKFQSISDMKRNGLLRPLGSGMIYAKLKRPKLYERFMGSKYVSAYYDEHPHALVVAPTRSGKGVGYVIPNILTFNGSTVILDVKGEIFEATSRYRQSRGDTIYRFAPFDFANPSHSYNPMERIAKFTDIEQQFTELEKLADYFLVTSSDGNASDFLNEGRLWFSIAALHAIERGVPTLGEVYRILFHGGEKKPVYTKISQTSKIKMVRDQFEYMANVNDKTLTSTLSVLSGAGLNKWINPRVERVTQKSDFSFSSIRSKPQSIYICVNADDIKTLAPLIRLVFSELIATLRATMPDEVNEPWPVLIMLDEFDQLGYMPIVSQSLKQLAGHNGRVSIITQSIPGLDAVYKDENERMSLEANAGIKFYLNANDKKTANELSDVLGKTTTLSVSDSMSGGPDIFGRRTVSRKNEERPLMLPQDITKLHPDKVILVPSGQNPVMAQRIKYYEDPYFMSLINAQSGKLPYPEITTSDIRSLITAEVREALDKVSVSQNLGVAGADATATETKPDIQKNMAEKLEESVIEAEIAFNDVKTEELGEK